METSIAELVSPIGDRSLEAALSERADDLASRAGGTEIAVTGAAPALPSTTVIHAYRILSEAMANAAHHSGGACVRVWLEDAGGALVAYVEDDGCGLPETLRPGANGLRTMRSRAFAIGGRLEIEPGPEGRGTRVRLEVPPPRDGAPSA
jgi:signal transduction histidine kinase